MFQIGSFCLSEPNSGSDAFAMKSVAVRDGDDYVITGNKSWITNSQEASFFLVNSFSFLINLLANFIIFFLGFQKFVIFFEVFANADIAKGYKGITAFLVDRNEKGVEVGRKEDKLGIRASSTCPIHFDSVRVHKDMVLGEVGKGLITFSLFHFFFS